MAAPQEGVKAGKGTKRPADADRAGHRKKGGAGAKSVAVTGDGALPSHTPKKQLRSPEEGGNGAMSQQRRSVSTTEAALRAKSPGQSPAGMVAEGVDTAGAPENRSSRAPGTAARPDLRASRKAKKHRGRSAPEEESPEPAPALRRGIGGGAEAHADAGAAAEGAPSGGAAFSLFTPRTLATIQQAQGPKASTATTAIHQPQRARAQNGAHAAEPPVHPRRAPDSMREPRRWPRAEESEEDGEEGIGNEEAEAGGDANELVQEREQEGEEGAQEGEEESEDEVEEEGGEGGEGAGATQRDRPSSGVSASTADPSPVAPSSFRQLGLATWLVDTCAEMGLRLPSPVQAACIPAALEGRNVLGVAQTGSGKTAAFALPILQKLAEDPYGVFALVLTPTRELGLQISEQFRALGANVRLRCAVVIGGADMTAQALALTTRPHVVVATPGRLREMLRSDPGMHRVFARMKFLVLDEADRLLDVGFQDEMQTIFGALPSARQTLLFSATITPNLHAAKDMKGPGGRGVFVFEAYAGLAVVESLDQSYVFMPGNVKDVYLCHILATLATESARSVIIFASTCRACQLLSTILDELGVANTPLHSLLPQRKRTASLHHFRAGAAPILVATDVASRGLDIPTVDLVINYDIPRQPRDYVHRVGRTARAGRGGRAISLITQYDVRLVQGIERLIGRMLTECTEVVEGEVLKGITKVFKARRAALLKIHETGFEDLVRERQEAKQRAKRVQLDS